LDPIASGSVGDQEVVSSGKRTNEGVAADGLMASMMNEWRQMAQPKLLESRTCKLQRRQRKQQRHGSKPERHDDGEGISRATCEGEERQSILSCQNTGVLLSIYTAEDT